MASQTCSSIAIYHVYTPTKLTLLLFFAGTIKLTDDVKDV